MIAASSLLEAVLLALIEEVCLSTPKVDNLGTSIAILLALAALPAVESVGDARTPANYAPTLVAAVVALVADPGELARAHVGVADDALPVTLLAEAADGDATLLPAHDQVWMMLRHDEAPSRRRGATRARRGLQRGGP